MKKAISALVSLVLCLSLCACGGASEPTYVTQEITIGNVDTYFEVIEQEQWRTNGFGEVEDYVVFYKIKVRDEYLSEVKLTDMDLTVEFSYTANYHDGIVDLITKEVEIGEIDPNVSGGETGGIRKVIDIKDMPEEGYVVDNTMVLYWNNGTQSLYVVEDMPIITRIKGTIQLAEE